MTEERIVQIIEAAIDEWDRIHRNGWNRPYMAVVPSPWHLAAKRICEELGAEAVPDGK